MMRPFFSFYGGKWRAAPHYPAPQHSIIIEPFAGSAGYSIRHHKRNVVLVEKDPIIAATWRFLIRASRTDILALPDLREGESVHDLQVSEEAKHVIGWWLQRGGARPNLSRSAWGREERYRNQFWGDAARKRIASQVEGIRHWKVIQGDYRDAPNIEATWFIDPPYFEAGRHYKHGSKGIDYSDLAAFCKSRKGQAMVCENVGADWLPFQPWRKIKANESRSGGKISNEALWTNGA